jgi:hypothetical protein
MTAWAASRLLHFDTMRVNADPYGEALPGDQCDLLGDLLPGQPEPVAMPLLAK